MLNDTSPLSGAAHYNIYCSNTSGTPGIYTTYTLQAGVTYTASAYVNTLGANAFGADGGVYLRIANASGNVIEDGIKIDYWTDTNIDNGWQRIFVTYTPTATISNARIYVMWEHCSGTVKVDNVQLEKAEVPASFNYLLNSSFETGETEWELSDENESIESGSGRQGTKAFRANGTPGAVLYAEQTIPMYKSAKTTFLLSGWSKADSIPDLEEKCDELTDKFWGITAKICYTDATDDTDEKFHMTFNEYAEDWQYASMAIVPKNTELTIKEVVVRICYFNNANGAWFDDISFTEEPVQTYVYDEEGNIKSVQATDLESETYEYDDLQNLIGLTTVGNGDYTYTYGDSNNEHLPTAVTNDSATMDVTYDSTGQALTTKLRDNTTSTKPLNMTSSATYSNGLLMTQTDNTGGTTSYSYNGDRELFSVKDAKNRTVETYQDNIWNRVDRTYQSGVIAANFGYSNGSLSSIIRGGYLAPGQTTKYNQIYGFTYDAFGNRKTATLKGETRNKENNTLLSSSTTKTLATYDYNAGNGTLKSMTYGPASGYTSKASYTYDSLDRLKTVHYSDSSITYGYQYNSEGDLAGITVNGTPTYSYTYDSLGRLIYSAKLSNKQPILYTLHQYDTADRLSGQGWQINGQGFAEKYTYNDNDGTLTKIQYIDGDTISDGSDNLSFTYNKIKQLTKRTSPKLDTAYSYRVLNSTNNTVTNQVATVQHTLKSSTNTKQPVLSYTYDAVGNITAVKTGTTAAPTNASITAASYTYDSQYQLTKEVLNIQSQNGLTQTSNYNFDTFGNLRSKSYSRSDGLSGTITFTYGNTAWQDQLTKVQRTDSSGANVSGNIYYDAVGNPTTYFNGKKNWTFTWQNGRQLKKAVSGNTTINNTYDVDGIRETKTVGGVTHTYTTLDGKVVREAYGNVKVDYLYDNTGRPYKLIVTEGTTKYTGFYILSLQGDVIGIVDTSGAKAVTYEYSAWGTLIGNTTNGSTNGSKLNQYNALKYRGYYYDADLAMYYLGSRFYDTEICRFINSDDLDYLGASGDFIGYNLYAYCANNPVNCKDESGEFAINIGFVVAGAVINLVTTYLAAQVTGLEYTLTDAVFAMAAGAANALPGGPAWSGLIAGVYAGVQSYNNGANRGQAVLCGVVSGACTTLGVSNLAKLISGVELTMNVAIAVDSIFCMGFNTVSAATYKSVTLDPIDKHVPQSDEKSKSGNKSKPKPRSKSSVTSGGGLADYFRYLYNGGTPV